MNRYSAQTKYPQLYIPEEMLPVTSNKASTTCSKHKTKLLTGGQQ